MVNIYNSLKGAFHELKQENSRHPLFIYILLCLVCVPMLYAANSISLALFALATFVTFKKQHVSTQLAMALPVLLYLLMSLSLLWTIDFDATSLALSKEVALLVIPVCFMIFQPLSAEQKQRIIRYYSVAMAGFSIFYLLKAAIRFAMTKDISVFFYHELVTKDVNAIHVSVYLSVAFCYFFTRPAKTFWEKIAAILLFVTVFLLSSKNIIAVFIVLMVGYYLFFLKASLKSKVLGIGVLVLLVSLLALIPKITDRFGVEYKTAMTDNTENHLIGNDSAKVYNVSISQAWNNDTFKPNDYFPGMAFRVYQFRIFLEMIREDNIFFTGYGLNASYPKIAEKTIGYNLFLGDEKTSGYQTKNFHNQYIQNFAELGVFGFLLLAAMLLLNLKNAVKTKDFVHISFAILMISLFLTESFLWRQRGVMFFTMMYCLFNSGMAIKNQKKI